MKKFFFITFLLVVLSCGLSAKQIDLQQYHQHSSVQWCWAISSLYRLELQGNEAILDLGSGDGKISAYLAGLVPEGSVVGLEPLAGAVDFASERFPPESISNLTFIDGDAAHYSSPGSYDLITAFCSFNWIDDKEGAFLHLAENLKPGGRALIVVPADLPAIEPLYRELAEGAGLTLRDCIRERVDVVFCDEDEMRCWLRALFSHLPDHEFAPIFEAHLNLVREHFPQAGDGRIYAFPYRLTLVLAK